MSKKALLKLLCAGAVVGAAAHLYKKYDGAEKKATLAKITDKVGKKVSAHAKKVGEMTKSSFKSIVNEVMDEFNETKDMSRDEIKELKTELVNSWDEIQTEFTGKKKPAAKKRKKK